MIVASEVMTMSTHREKVAVTGDGGDGDDGDCGDDDDDNDKNDSTTRQQQLITLDKFVVSAASLLMEQGSVGVGTMTMASVMVADCIVP